MKRAPRQPDRLDFCHTLGLVVLLLATLAALVVCVDAALRGNAAGDQSARLVRAFGFDRLSLVPSGRSSASSAMPNAAVEWRYDPHLTGLPQDATDLILTAAD